MSQHENASVFESWPHSFEPGSKELVVSLHGTGGSERDGARLAQRIAAGASILAPRGRVVENSASRWFRRISEGIFDVDDVIDRAAELAGFVRWAVSHYSMLDSRVTVIGFSNGANMALALAALHSEQASSVVAFSGMYPFGDRSLALQLPSTRILLLNGEADAMAPPESVDTLVRNAELWGATLTRLTRPGGHGIAESELDAATLWMRGL